MDNGYNIDVFNDVSVDNIHLAIKPSLFDITIGDSDHNVADLISAQDWDQNLLANYFHPTIHKDINNIYIPMTPNDDNWIYVLVCHGQATSKSAYKFITNQGRAIHVETNRLLSELWHINATLVCFLCVGGFFTIGYLQIQTC